MGSPQGKVSLPSPFAPAVSGMPGEKRSISGIVGDDTRQGGRFGHRPVTLVVYFGATAAITAAGFVTANDSTISTGTFPPLLG